MKTFSQFVAEQSASKPNSMQEPSMSSSLLAKQPGQDNPELTKKPNVLGTASTVAGKVSASPAAKKLPPK